MRIAVRALVVALLLVPAIAAAAEEFSACWVATVWNETTLRETTITRCRIAGGEVVDYGSDLSVPSRLYPNLGIDLNGECWYLTSAATSWVYLSLFVNGDAILGWDPDPAIPGGVALATTRIPRCTSEPNPAVNPETEVWQYVTQYIHDPPTPDLSPPPGEGVAGLETFIGVIIPDDHVAQIVSTTGLTLDIEINVSGVTINWGDGDIDSLTADREALSGYPEGAVTHTYEVKDESGYQLSASYEWRARWRVAGGTWESLAVPSTTTSVVYPVAEIVSVITE